MNENETWWEILKKFGLAILAGLSSLFCIMRYYPLVTAMYAVCCLQESKSLWLYIGLFAGMIVNMSVSDFVKYLFVILIMDVAIRFYYWANRKCSGKIGGLVAFLATVGLNCSGQALGRMDRSELILGVSEGALVYGAVVGGNFLVVMIKEYIKTAFFSKETKEVGKETISYSEDGRMHAFVAAVDELSNAFVNMGNIGRQREYERVEALQQELTGKLCAACEGCAVCWSQGMDSFGRGTATSRTEGVSGGMFGKLQTMLQAVVAHRSKEDILQENYMEECPLYSGMVEEAIWAFSRMELNEAWYNRLKENRMVIAKQLDAMSNLLQDWNKENRLLDVQSKLLLARIRFETREKGILAEQIHIYENEQKLRWVEARVSSKWGGGIPNKSYLQALEKACGRAMRLKRDSRSIITKEAALLTAYEDTAFYALSGVAGRKKDGAVVSGDNFSFFELESGTYHICLSDGMGSGPSASKESDLVVDLMEKFMEAGFARETALWMMNSAMVLQGEDDSFSTLDFATIDLYSGHLELTKIGAAASFIKTRKGVYSVGETSLPAGVDLTQKVMPIQSVLEHGEFLVMVTDGVLEYLHVKNPEEKFCEIVEDVFEENAGAFAKAVMERVLLFTGGHAKDDMTVLVTGIWEKT